MEVNPGFKKPDKLFTDTGGGERVVQWDTVLSAIFMAIGMSCLLLGLTIFALTQQSARSMLAMLVLTFIVVIGPLIPCVTTSVSSISSNTRRPPAQPVSET
ncbi:hypothetical protein BDV93DRAFT_529259 [Ceratobasidium sp. AG-I]|nr:hypothetical protein BDV93DRAFT_529259 [Ceratobasidium sp. AG-I]